MVPEHCVIASNTSAIPIQKIAMASKDPAKVHYLKVLIDFFHIKTKIMRTFRWNAQISHKYNLLGLFTRETFLLEC